MKPKTLVLMVVAVTCGLGASYMTSRLLAERSQEDVEKVQVLVAKRNLNMGETIKNPQDLFEMKEYTKGEEPREAIRELESLKGRVLKIHRRAGDFIRNEDVLSSNDPAASFASHLPTGYRAVGLRVNLESSGAGWATLPLSRVDVINTVRRGDDRSTYSQFLLENVLVLAIDQGNQRNEEGRPMPGQVVLFALSPEDVLKMSVAREVGTLTLALRKMNDFSKAGEGKLTLEDIRNGHTREKGEGSEPFNSDGPSGTSTTTASAPGFTLPSLPSVDRNAAKPAEEVKASDPPAFTGVNHTLVVTEGGSSRTVSFLLDKQGHVMNQDVTRSELTPPRPGVERRPDAQ